MKNASDPGPGAGVPAIEAHGLTRRYGDTAALADVDLLVRPGEFFSLLGPSGCGKTTLLRLLAGLDRPDEGTLRINGLDAAGIPAHRRPVNTVFQSYALFPHMTVAHNIGFGLRMKRVPRPELARRVERIMEMVQIRHLRGRRPAELSGGEKQRVALARAVVNEPAILLLDEPLGALDLKLRKELQSELHSLQRRLGITFVYVTHDQEEALALSDRMAVLKGGRVEQTGTGQEVYERPRNRFVADFLGGCNFLDATTDDGEFAMTALGRVRLPSGTSVRGRATLAVRPEKLVIAAGETAENRFGAVVTGVRYGGLSTLVELEASGQTLKMTALNTVGGWRAPRVGETLRLAVPAEALVVLREESR